MPSRLAVVTFLDEEGGPVYPSHGLPSVPGYPSNGLPNAPVYPSHGLPGGPVTLPVFPFDPTRPDAGLPSSGNRPDNSLPGGVIRPGARFVVKWLACQGLILVPDNTLPSGGGSVDNTLPSEPTTPDNTLPPTAEPKY